MSRPSNRCAHHRPKDLGYLEWHAWAQKMTDAGKEQTQCPKCKHWFFKSEMGKQPTNGVTSNKT